MLLPEVALALDIIADRLRSANHVLGYTTALKTSMKYLIATIHSNYALLTEDAEKRCYGVVGASLQSLRLMSDRDYFGSFVQRVSGTSNRIVFKFTKRELATLFL